MLLPASPPCGPGSALLHPLISTQDNAFNPCFLAALSASFSAFYAVLAAASLYRIKYHPICPQTGSFTPKNTGLSFYVRIMLVAAHNLAWCRLVWALSPVERISDAKIPAFYLLTGVNVFLVMPLHIFEVAARVVPSGVLLTYWPVLFLVECMLYFQDTFTAWPLFLFEASSNYIAISASCSLLIFGMEYWKWSPMVSVKRHLLEANHFDPEITARALSRPNILQRLTFSWMNPLIRNSYVNQTIHYDDLPEAPEGFTTEAYTASLKQKWDVPGRKKGKMLLLLSLFRTYGPNAIVSFVYEAGDSLLGFIQPQLLRVLILFLGQKIDDPKVPFLKGVLVCLSMFAVTIVQTALNNQYVLKILEVGLGCRSSLTSLIFQKSMKLSARSRTLKSSGEIINLVSIDAPRVQTCAQELNTVVIAPVELVLAIWSLYSLLGKSAFSGLVVMLAFMPVNTFFFRYSKRLKKKQMKLKDARNRITNEILVSMKSIKLYSWEKPMLERLTRARNDMELRNARKIRVVNQFGNLIWVTMPFLVSFSTFASFALLEETPLTSDIIFPALALLNILARPIQSFPQVLTYITEGYVAVERISEFLLLSEIDPRLIERGGDPATSLEVQNVSFLWDKPELSLAEDTEYSTYKYALRDISIHAKKGDFMCIVGRVGAGKSAFLSSILGQLDATDADTGCEPTPMKINGSIAFCSQNPWIMNASVRENVLFGHELDEPFYMQTMEACQLLPDLKTLPDGHETQVGEKGISLSGGQKARISLARAIYARADIYILDDVLSAVDSHVGKSIVSEVLCGMLAEKTVVLTTNSIPVLQCADCIFLLEQGRIVETARSGEIGPQCPRIQALVDECGSSPAPPATFTRNGPEKARLAEFAWDPFKANVSKTGPVAEVAAKGSVKWHVYRAYIQACSGWGMLLWILLFITATALSFATNYWLKTWAEKNSQSGGNTRALHFIGIFALLGFSTSAMNLAKGLVFWVFLAIQGGRSVHDQMAQRIMKAPMSFFERTPVGRIMNRFSNDINKVDDALPRSINIYLGCFFKTLSTVIVITAALPAFSVVVVFLVFIYGYYQKYYISVQRELKRLVSISRSPIFAHIGESLAGVETIRAYSQETRFSRINSANVDFNMRSLFMLRSINRWLSVRLQFIGSLIIWSASTLLIYKSTTSTPVSAGLAGFLMSYTLQVTEVFKRMVRMSAEVEANVVSVERCFEYCRLPTEEAEDGDFLMPPAGWPAHGSLSLQSYSTQYSPGLEPVLKDVNLSIEAGEKIGVVGRTGAGKSSLVLAIFRMIPPVSGTISIDGVDVSKLALFDLRHNLSIIPQDSHLYQGTLRENLDPFREHSDERLWEVISHSSLLETVQNLDGGLEAGVIEGGSNFSVGQRQLVCLARALLNPSKILMLDEATAAVDIQTDRIIQSTIRREFKNKTIITIAHRLDTVMDSDRILSLDHGEVQEYDSPEVLLKNNGVFSHLCQQGNYTRRE